MKFLNEKVFFLDLQTTGAKPPAAQILEMAWGHNLHEDIFSSVFTQEFAVPRQILQLTGINPQELESAKPWKEVFQDFHNFLAQQSSEKPLIIIHFAQFEKKFLDEIYARLEQEIPFEIICTHEISKRLLPNLPTRGLKGLAGYFGYPSLDLKRASSHVHATQEIWKGLIPLMEEKGLQSLSDVKSWLDQKEKIKKGKYEYPLPKEKRLALPKKPGIYRMISRWGEVLYVGKATSLRDRVNSYFRGQKNRDSRKLEMLTQVWDLIVTPVETPLEAALLETDEIKKLNPRYNISLKTGKRTLAFFDKNFNSIKTQADSQHTIGPFSNALTLDSMLRLRNSIQSGLFDEHMFFDPFDPGLISAGFEVFCNRHALKILDFKNFRNILAVGLNWFRKLKDSEASVIEEDEDSEIEELAHLSPPTELSESLPNFDDLATKFSLTGDISPNRVDHSIVEDSLELSPEDMADKFERHFIRAAAAYVRSKRLTKLLNSKVEIKKDFYLRIQNGFILDPQMEWSPQENSWQGHSIETYDRMSVLLSELTKIKNLSN